MNSRYLNSFRFFFVLIDLAMLNTIQFAFLVNTQMIGPHSERNYSVLFFSANMLWLFSAYGTGMYVDNGSLSFYRFAKRTFKSLGFFYVLMLIFVFLYHYAYSRVIVLSLFALFGAALFLSRTLLLSASHYFGRWVKSSRRVVIVGYNEAAKKLAAGFSRNSRPVVVDGYFENTEAVYELSMLPVIGQIDQCLPYAIANHVTEIYSTVSPESNHRLYEMAQAAEKSLIRFRFVPDFKMFVNRNIHMEYVNDTPVISLRPEPLEDISNSIKKRAFDVVFSLLVILFIMSWLTPLIALLIKLNSRGPVFFTQLRSGKDNRQFRCFKFRSLSVNPEAHQRQVTRNDSRVTRLGGFLRKSNIDELPQFFNVLAGQMSVVGPRPHMLSHTESFSKLMGAYMIRHFVKPGVTGWAQVKGFRGEIREEQQLQGRIEHDLFYMENWSLWFDLRIIWQTIANVVQGDKNAF